jgi:hypothetical protein
MKAFLIDPFTQTINEVDYNGDYKSIYSLISSSAINVDTFTCVNLNEQEDTIFVDDEGLLKDLNSQRFFTVNGHVLAGKGLVLGTNEEGESVSPKITIEQLRGDFDIKFPSNEVVINNANKSKGHNFK